VGETKIDFDKLAVSIIEAYESDREESGRSELAKGMEYVLDKYKSDHDREVISEMLIAFTGYSLDTLLKMQTKSWYAVDIEWDTSDLTDEETAESNLPEEVRLPDGIVGRLAVGHLRFLRNRIQACKKKLRNRRKENIMEEWVIIEGSSECDPSVSKFTGTKDEVKKLLMAMVDDDRNSEDGDTDGFEYGTESIDEIAEEGNTLNAYSVFSSYHVDYVAVRVKDINEIKRTK
jgi:hypothetical protein